MDLSLGIWKPSELEVQEERDVLMRSQYYDPIERFPEKIDQLLEALNRVRFHFLMIKNQTRFVFHCSDLYGSASRNAKAKDKNSLDASHSPSSSYSTGLI